MRFAVLCLLFLSTAVLPASAKAEEAPTKPKKEAKKATEAKPPAPPLFKKHRRGTYRNQAHLLVIDPTPQSPPLETDDPGVPDKGEVELNLTSDADLTRDEREVEFVRVDANYGIEPKILGHGVPTQVALEAPWEGENLTGQPTSSRIGPIQFGLKFNVHDNERKGLYVSLYPQVEFITSGNDTEQQGAAEKGQTLIVPLLIQKEFHDFTAVANVGWLRPLNDPTRDVQGVLSLAAGRALTPRAAAMAEIHSTSSIDLKRERLIVINLGYVHYLANDATLLAKIGHSIVSDDGPGHFYIGAGIKITRLVAGGRY